MDPAVAGNVQGSQAGFCAKPARQELYLIQALISKPPHGGSGPSGWSGITSYSSLEVSNEKKRTAGRFYSFSGHSCSVHGTGMRMARGLAFTAINPQGGKTMKTFTTALLLSVLV